MNWSFTSHFNHKMSARSVRFCFCFYNSTPVFNLDAYPLKHCVFFNIHSVYFSMENICCKKAKSHQALIKKERKGRKSCMHAIKDVSAFSQSYLMAAADRFHLLCFTPLGDGRGSWWGWARARCRDGCCLPERKSPRSHLRCPQGWSGAVGLARPSHQPHPGLHTGPGAAGAERSCVQVSCFSPGLTEI